MSEPTIKTDELSQSIPGDPPAANGAVSAATQAQDTGTDTSGASLASPPASSPDTVAHEAQDAAAEAAVIEVSTGQTNPGKRLFTWLYGPEVAILLILVGAPLLWGLLGVRPSGELQIVASHQSLASADDGTTPAPDPYNQAPWVLTGRVFDRDGQPVPDAVVWAIISDEAGHQHARHIPNTDKAGKFASDPIPAALALHGPPQTVKQAKIYALQQDKGWFGRRVVKHGETLLELGQNTQWLIQGAVTYVVFILAWFGASIFIAFMSDTFPKRVYYALLILAFGFTILMGGFLAMAQIQLGTTMTRHEAINLGIAHIFKGSYIKDHEPEQLISLTVPPMRKSPASVLPVQDPNATGQAPTPKAEDTGKGRPDEPDVVRGFGAPLWVLLLAVVGSGLFTMSLIVNEIQNPPDFSDPDRSMLRGRIENIVEHQFFILFAPLGGLFLYQLLLLAGSASQHVSVGIAALGAGAMLNLLLAKAIKVVQESLK